VYDVPHLQGPSRRAARQRAAPQLAHVLRELLGWGGDPHLGDLADLDDLDDLTIEVLGRLPELNQERYAEEVKGGLHEKKGAKAKIQAVQDGLF
jgi:hypothetical protein